MYHFIEIPIWIEFQDFDGLNLKAETLTVEFKMEDFRATNLKYFIGEEELNASDYQEISFYNDGLEESIERELDYYITNYEPDYFDCD